jgi:hypothetical protein
MQLKTTARNFFCSIIILVQIVSFPALALAQEAAPENTSATTSSAPTPPASSEKKTPPTNPSAKQDKTYKDNGDGTWSNGEYTWNAKTQQTKPNKPQDYSYNPASGHWDTRDWAYSQKTGRYEPNNTKPATQPKAAVAKDQAPDSKKLSVSGTGPDSNSSVKVNGNSGGTFDLFFDGSISNSYESNATSGDALVQGNTTAGSALSGDAAAIATLLNLLQSSWLEEDSQIATFINNIDGNVYGDLLIDPAKLPYNLAVGNSDVDVNIATSGVINNDINLAANSGNATVDSNTTAGNATSGNANAMANVVNMINSAIDAGQSFIGMVNINGTLNGDILLPLGILEALIANTGVNSANVGVNSSVNQTVNNNVQTAAASGDALVGNNTKAGNATSGQAQTAINTMNLVGQNLVGNNALLVFVNVLGKWVGMVVSPSGATIAQTGPNSMNTVDAGGNHSVSVSATENSLINNDISVAAQSGTARVTNNTTAGNATAGNASASVNLLNMIGSNVQMTDWFGVLFINVFGEWLGSFGADTANGGYSQNPPAKPAPSASGGIGGSQQTTTPVTTAVANGGGTGKYRSSTNDKVFGFAAGGLSNGGSGPIGEVTSSTVIIPLYPEQFVFGDGPSGAVQGNSQRAASGASTSSGMNWWLLFGGVGMIATLAVLAREYVLAIREEQRLA